MKAKTKVIVTLGVHKDKEGVTVGNQTNAMKEQGIVKVKIEGDTHMLPTLILKEKKDD